MAIDVERLKQVLKPFAHPDLHELLSGNRPMDGDDPNDSIVFQRNNAVLTIGDFKAAWELYNER